MAAWAPWVIVSVVLMLWAWKAWKSVIDIKGVTFIEYAIPGLHQLIERVAPVVASPHPEAAVFKFGLLSSIGTGILIAGIISGFIMKISPREMWKSYAETFSSLKFSFSRLHRDGLPYHHRSSEAQEHHHLGDVVRGAAALEQCAVDGGGALPHRSNALKWRLARCAALARSH